MSCAEFWSVQFCAKLYISIITILLLFLVQFRSICHKVFLKSLLFFFPSCSLFPSLLSSKVLSSALMYSYRFPLISSPHMSCSYEPMENSHEEEYDDTSHPVLSCRIRVVRRFASNFWMQQLTPTRRCTLSLAKTLMRSIRWTCSSKLLKFPLWPLWRQPLRRRTVVRSSIVIIYGHMDGRRCPRSTEMFSEETAFRGPKSDFVCGKWCVTMASQSNMLKL